MSRSANQKRRGYPVCSGCSACSWYPKRLQRAGKRSLEPIEFDLHQMRDDASECE